VRTWATVSSYRGRGEDSSWTPEPSFLVLGVTRKDAVALGRRYGQLAVVCGTLDSRAALVPCEPRPADRRTS